MADLFDTNDTRLLTRDEARREHAPTYTKGKLCSKKHLPMRRYTSHGECVICHAETQQRLKAEDPQKYNEAKRRSAEKAECREQNRLASQRVRERNPDKNRLWKKANPDKVRALRAVHGHRRRAFKLHATPKWVDWGAITAIYLECARITKETGIKHHVDHIVPLVNKGVCGLHVHWNLQIITAEENYAKNNKLIPELAMAA